MGRKYQFMESNMQRRIVGLDDKMPDIQKTLETVRFLKTRKVRDVWFGWCGELSSDNLIAWLGSDWGYIWAKWYSICKSACTADWGSLFMARGTTFLNGPGRGRLLTSYRQMSCCLTLLTKQKSFYLRNSLLLGWTNQTAKRTLTFWENKLQLVFSSDVCNLC